MKALMQDSRKIIEEMSDYEITWIRYSHGGCYRKFSPEQTFGTGES